MARLIKITHERLTEVLDYDPASGAFYWKVRPCNRIHIGDRAGVVGGNNQRFITVDGEKLQANRIAWFYVHKEWPRGDIKYRNGDSDDCAIGNLRDVDRVSGARERGLVSNNSTGFKGVSPAPFGKFQSKITWNYKQISLGGNFDTAEEASAVYQDAEARLASTEDVDGVMEVLRLEKRQRAVWANLQRGSDVHTWQNFREFSADVVDIPEHRYAIAPINAAMPIGNGNYQWASGGHEVKSTGNHAAYNKANREANRDHHRGRDFRKKYGIEFGDYQRMLSEQCGVCACCERPESRLTDAGDLRMLSVDHDHTTGAVRGLLCSNCNLVLGYACDDMTVLEKAIVYLRKYGAPSNVVKFEPMLVNGIMGNGT